MKLRFIDLKELNPVVIELENNRTYAQVAFLVDSPSFLNSIDRLRSKYQIKKPFNNYRSWLNHLISLSGFNLKEYQQMNSLTDQINNPDDPKLSKKMSWLEKNEHKFLKLSQLQKSFQDEIVSIRNHHHYPSSFDKIIVDTIILNKVSNFQGVSSEVFWGNVVGGLTDDDSSKIGLFINPYSTKDELLKSFQQAKEKYNQEFEMVSPLNKKLGKDTLSNIVRDRTWHWKQLKGMTYNQIADEWNNAYPDDYITDTNKLEHAVARYRKNLQRDISKTDI